MVLKENTIYIYYDYGVIDSPNAQRAVTCFDDMRGSSEHF